MEFFGEKQNYVFTDETLIRTALSHASYANELHWESNERLEFVGDSVLGMVVADALYRRFPGLSEGRMTRLRAELVCERSLFEVASRLGLGEHLRLGRGEEVSGGRSRHSILADCVEAVIAAIYLDGGLERARSFIDEHILSKLSDADGASHDYKTELQELIQQTPGRAVTYELTGESGPDHAKRFTAAVLICGQWAGAGEGRSKKEAEQMAAKAALEGLGK